MHTVTEGGRERTVSAPRAIAQTQLIVDRAQRLAALVHPPLHSALPVFASCRSPRWSWMSVIRSRRCRQSVSSPPSTQPRVLTCLCPLPLSLSRSLAVGRAVQCARATHRGLAGLFC